MSKPAGVTSVVVGPADRAHRRDVAGRSGGEDVDRRVVADEGLVVRVISILSTAPNVVAGPAIAR